MKLLFLSESYYPRHGGAELASHLYSKMLAQTNNKVVVLTDRLPAEPKVSESRNQVVYRLELIGGGSKYSILSRIDILYSNFFRKLIEWSDLVYIPRYWFSAIPIIKRMNRPVVVHLHDYIPVCSLSNLYDTSRNRTCENTTCKSRCVWANERQQGRGQKEAFLSTLLNPTVGRGLARLVKMADAVICVSEKHREIIVNRIPEMRGITHVVYNPIPETSKMELIGSDFGYFGGYNKLKGFPVLVESMKMLQRDQPPRIHATQLLKEQTDTELTALREKGFIPYGRLADQAFNKMYEHVQTVIVPSVWHEPLPYVVAEALTRGRLVIASRVGGIPELLHGCKGSIICEPGNASQLADSLQRVMSMSGEEKMKLRDNNREIFKKRFNNGINFKRFLNIISELV